MKILILVLLFTTASFAIESGGVDVGNSNQKGKFALPIFKSEEAMVNHLNELMPQIEKGEHKEVQKLMKRGKCPAPVKFGELSVIPSYEYNKSTKKLDKEFSGEVTVVFKDCKRPRKL